jgi:hypothetical protein
MRQLVKGPYITYNLQIVHAPGETYNIQIVHAPSEPHVCHKRFLVGCFVTVLLCHQ